MDVLDRDPERLREIELEQPVVADHLHRDLLARTGELDRAVALPCRDEVQRRELLGHRARRGA